MVLYLTPNDVLGINEQFVGSGQLRDYGLLDAAVTRPQASAFGQDAYPTIHEKAAETPVSLYTAGPVLADRIGVAVLA
ncbi:death-on-curing family protein, partial [Mycolicibacterium phlei]|nr:death-on-curing family protein [Mycolicibacterium phlei]